MSLTCEVTLSSRPTLSSRTSQTYILIFYALKQTPAIQIKAEFKAEKYQTVARCSFATVQRVQEAPASFYLASAAKLPPKCRQARTTRLLRAFSRVFFSLAVCFQQNAFGCVIQYFDRESKRKPKNCWHLQQNFVFCVIAITRPRTGNSFKTGLG